MREIKVRGWHTVQKTMFSPEEMAADQLALLPTGEFINVSGDSTRLSTIYPKDKFIPLLYIGLKDKQGKEAYFDDLVKWGKSIYKVIWDDDKGVTWMEKTSGSDSWGRLRIHLIDEGEIIGNIYENPELMEVNDV